MSMHRTPLSWALALLVAAGLGVDAYVHLHLAPGYQLAAPGGIGQGNLFRIQAVVALLVAVAVLVTGHRLAFAAAAGVGFSAVAAVVLTRYVEVPAFGPMPSMYEPIWFFEKSLSAVAEAAVGVLGVIGALYRPRVSAPEAVLTSH